MLLEALSLLWAMEPLAATAEAVERREERAGFEASVATDFQSLSSFPLDDTGMPSDRSLYLDARLRLSGRLTGDRWRLLAEVDVIDGQIAGERSDVGTTLGPDTFDRRRDRLDGFFAITPRALRIELDTEIGRFALGQDVPTWGLGMLINGGTQDAPFGRVRGGGSVSRFAFATKPLRAVDAPALVRELVIAVAGDLVYHDDQAHLLRGDLAGGPSLVLLARDPDTAVGVLGALRLQRDRARQSDPGGVARTLQVLALDAFLRRTLLGDPSGDVELSLGVEGALTLGSTDRLVLESTAVDGAAVRGVAALAQAELRVQDWLWARLEAGVASGDDDPYDDVARTFSFSTAHPVGLVLFSQVLPMMSARAADRLASPELRDQAPPGLRSSVNQGSVSGARYLYPTVRVRPWETLEVRVGTLIAGTSGAATDLYRTAEAGGYTTAPNGARAGPALLGQELLLGLRGDLRAGPLQIQPGLDLSLFLPGPMLSELGFDTIGAARATLDLRL